MKRWALVSNNVCINIVQQDLQPDSNWEDVSNITIEPGYTKVANTWTKPSIRKLTKLQFISRLTNPEFISLLTAAKSDVNVEAFVKMMEWATPDPDGTSINLDDPRTIAGIYALFSVQRAGEILS